MATRRELFGERGGASASLRSLHPRTPAFDAGWLTALESWSGAAIQAAAVGSLVVVATLDALAGSAIGFSAFYLMPVVLAAWRLGRTGGLVWAVVAAVTWLAVDRAAGLHSASVVVWDGALRLATFAVVALSIAALRRQRDLVRTLAGTDQLTGVLNGRSFEELVELERSRALRYNRPFTLAYLDIDALRRVNEEWGHAAGDQALRIVAGTIRENVRSMDTVARMGGDEFALLLPETGEGAAEIALGKIQMRLTEEMEARSLELTFTIGVVVCVGAPQSADVLLGRAESLMYAVKKGGGALIRTEVLDEHFGIEAILQRS